MFYWPKWPIVQTFIAWYEFGVVVNGTGDARVLNASLAWLHNASDTLQSAPMGYDWSGTRWQDFLYTIQVVADCSGTPASEQAFLASLSSVVFAQGVKILNWTNYYTDAHFPHTGVPSWDYIDHGVNNGMAAKGGAVTWRAGYDPTGNVSSYTRVGLYDKYQGAPSGVFQADECFAGSMPSRGTETCAVVELAFSYSIVHETQGDAFFAERAERIVYNALPGALTKDMWARVYLQQANEVSAVHLPSHVWVRACG